MNLPSGPSGGPYDLSLEVPAFYLLLALLGLFLAMWWVLRRRHPRGRRGAEGFLEAAGVDIAFLGFAIALVAILAWSDPHGNRTAFALYEVVLGGYWLAFAIPIVTVGFSVHSRSRGGIAWRLPSILLAAALFVVAFAWYYTGR